MLIKFKLQIEYPTKGNYSELQVTECTHNHQVINRIKIALTEESKSLIKNGADKSFVIQNIQENEIESSSNTLKINSARAIITPFKTDFLFAAEQVKQINGHHEIELAFFHLWNGEKIKKIHLLADNQYRNLIEENKDKYLFQLTGIKSHDLISLTDQTSKILNVKNNFHQLNIAVPCQINLEVPVKKLEVLNNDTYLFAAQEVLARWGLKDYEKIELITKRRINEKEIIRFTIPDLHIVLSQDKEDKVLRIGQAYHSLMTWSNPEVSLDNPAAEAIQKFLAKYQNHDYRKRTKNCQKNLQKYSVLLQQIFPPTKAKNSPVKALIKQQNDLSRQLETFANSNKLQKKLAVLKEKHPDSNQLDQLSQELKKLDQEFLALEKEIARLDFSVNECVEKNWTLILLNDSQFQQLLTNYKLSPAEILENLTLPKFYSYLQEDGRLDYSNLEALIKKIKTQSSGLNYLGYEATEIVPGGKYEEWNQAQIKKNEAIKAIGLGYSTEQWNDPQYQEYKEINRALADSIITIFHRKWDPPLTELQKEVIKNSQTAYNLVSSIGKVQEERYLHQVKPYFKNFINQELKKAPAVELNELGSLMNYEKEINELNDHIELRIWVEKIMTKIKIKKNRRHKIASIEELREQAKKNISEILDNFKLKSSELHPRYQNWLTELEKMESKSSIFQFEQDLTLLLIEVNCLLRQKWFPNLDAQEKEQIKQVKDAKGIEKQIRTLLEKKQNWLIIWQINSLLRSYREMQNENEQDYFSQRRPIFEVQILLHSIVGHLNKEQNELLQNASILLDKFHYLFRIKSAQESFNEISNNSSNKKKEQLQLLQKIFREWAEKEELNGVEKTSQSEIETKLNLIKQGKVVGKLAILNERQADLSLLDLPLEASEESEIQIENDFGLFSQQALTLLAVGGFLLIFLWRWYRKKREEDPFW